MLSWNYQVVLLNVADPFWAIHIKLLLEQTLILPYSAAAHQDQYHDNEEDCSQGVGCASVIQHVCTHQSGPCGTLSI